MALFLQVSRAAVWSLGHSETFVRLNASLLQTNRLVLPHVMFMSTLTPGGLSAVMMARVEVLSTSVAVNPPCMVPPRLRWDSSTVSSQVHFPGIADTTSSCVVRDRGLLYFVLYEMFQFMKQCFNTTPNFLGQTYSAKRVSTAVWSTGKTNQHTMLLVCSDWPRHNNFATEKYTPSYFT